MTRPRAVFFDSGDTLLRPIDNWWPKPRTRELISAADLPLPNDSELLATLGAAAPSMNRRRVTPTLHEELDTYVGFYEVVLNTLFEAFPTRLPHALAEAAVYELDQEPFEDTLPALERLASAALRLGVISNAGPSLELRYRDLGIRGFFDPFIISAVVGCEKPEQRIYQLALDIAALAPEDVVFVDDRPDNVRTATDLGMNGYVVDRTGDVSDDLPSIAGLTELADMLSG